MNRERLGSRLGFILLSAGCAIGLGNVYRFPIWAGAYGGALFVLIYLAFLVLLGIPAMCCELAVGRGSQQSIATSFDVLKQPGQHWGFMKYLGVAGNYLLMMFYTCISGWFAVYFIKYLTGSITAETSGQSLEQMSETLGGVFGGIVTNFGLNEIVTIAVIIICFGVCAIGLKKGVENITKTMMILLMILIIGLVIYSLTMDGAAEGLKFYLIPSLEPFREFGVWTVISAAMSQAFFTLSVGIGSIAIFGSYIGKEKSLLGEAVTIISLDTFIAIMAGLIIFPAFFTFNPGGSIGADQAGAGFLFITLSSIFNNMAGGRILGTLFFMFMVFASFSTVIAVFENIISFWNDLGKVKRPVAAAINIVLLAVLTVPFILCNCSESWGAITIIGKNIGDFEDFLVSNFALPFGSMCYVLFCTHKFGWGWDNFIAEVNAGTGKKLPLWLKPYMKWILPIIIAVILIMSIVPAFIG